ncbi:MAG: hypothetical protein ABIK68_15795 [bacterium]
MTSSARIKRFLKKGIEAEILSVDQVLQLKAEHLAGVTELQDIDEDTINATLAEIKAIMRSGVLKKKSCSVDNAKIMKLIEKKAASYTEAVKKIFYV